MLGHSKPDSDQMNNVPHNDVAPILRIGLKQHVDTIEFKLSGRFSVFNDQGIPILKEVTSPVKWRLKIEQQQPAKYTYSILLGKFINRQDAQDLEYQLIEKGIGARIKTRGGKLFHSNRVVNDNTQYWIVADDLSSEAEAKKLAEERLHAYTYEIIKEKIIEPHAILELFDSEYEKLGEAENVLRIIPESPQVVSYVYDLPTSYDQKKRTNKHCIFKGPLEFRSSDSGKIIIICEMPIEKYVEAVVSQEMQPYYPIEAIKAQAVAVRSKTVASLGIKHYDDPFHLCADFHCQQFSGITQTSDEIMRAISETSGMVIQKGQETIDAYYTLNCGGHTEDEPTTGVIGTYPQYFSICDSANKEVCDNFADLTENSNLNEWLQNEPIVNCNPKTFQANENYHEIRNKFRWIVNYDHRELEEIISSKFGQPIGDLYDIIVLERGVSGRATKVEILASNRNVFVKGEDNIRKILASEELPSSCFMIKTSFDEDGFPIHFSIRGAGSGHGIGLCQTGAIGMALKGKNQIEILNHYFNEINIKKIY